MNPLIAGLLGAVGGAALWGWVLAPAPKDSFIWCTDAAKAERIKFALAESGIQASVQNVLNNYAVLVSAADHTKAISVASIANLLP
jgi:hypothetical protein